jgi:hypothetical protein
MDRGLISEIQRGLSAKSAKTGPRVDFKETHGLLCKIPGNIDSTNYFPMVKVVDRVHTSVNREQSRPTVDHGHRPGQRVSERGGAFTGVWPPAAPVHQSSPAGGGNRERRARRARLGPHWSSGGGVEAGRRRWREEVTGNSVGRVSGAGEEKGAVRCGVLL